MDAGEWQGKTRHRTERSVLHVQPPPLCTPKRAMSASLPSSLQRNGEQRSPRTQPRWKALRLGEPWPCRWPDAKRIAHSCREARPTASSSPALPDPTQSRLLHAQPRSPLPSPCHLSSPHLPAAGTSASTALGGRGMNSPRRKSSTGVGQGGGGEARREGGKGGERKEKSQLKTQLLTQTEHALLSLRRI